MLIVFGSMNMDLVSRVSRLPVPGETLIGSAFFQAPGGKGANQAVAARRIGAAVAMIGCVGADSFGQTFLHDLAADGIDVRGVRSVSGVATGIGQIALGDDGQNQIIVCPGANFSVGDDEFAALERLLPSAKALLLQLEVPMEANVRAAALAAKHGVPVLLDPAPAQPLPPELLRGAVLKPNATEAAALLGDAVENVADAKRAAQALRQRGAKAAIVTLGEHGGYFATEGEEGAFTSFPVKAIDTVAAGDAFQGAFAAALAEGKRFGEAVRWGAAAGALATTKLGAMPSLPTRAEVEALLRK